jgi:hypothetical protein
METYSPHPGVITNGPVDIPTERATALVRAAKKAWQTLERYETPPTQRMELSVYMLGVGGYTHGIFLAYDFAEVAAFLGGVADGEFDDLLDETMTQDELDDLAEEPQLFDEEPEPPSTDWEAAPLPPGITGEQLVEKFLAVQDDVYWEVFGGELGPAWGRVRFTMDASAAPERYVLLEARVDPPFDLAEIRATARLPHPPPMSDYLRTRVDMSEHPEIIAGLEAEKLEAEKASAEEPPAAE